MQLVAKDPAWRPPSAAEVAQQAGRLRRDLRDDLSVDPGRMPYPLAAAAAVPPPPSAMEPAAAADDAWWPFPCASQPASRARVDAARPRRRPVLVLACAAIAGLIGIVLAVTVSFAPVQHLAGALPSAPPGHSTSGTAAGPPARQPSSANPGRSARHGTSPGDTGTMPVVVTDHQTITGSASSQERIRLHRDGTGSGHGHGHRNGRDHGHGHGHGNSQGNGNAPVLSMSS
jgi:hypothetical protein